MDNRLAEIDKEMLRQDFWEDPKSKEFLKERSLLIEQKENVDHLSEQYEE
ncbi:MAG TPA: peptide chain release factor 2, partial [Deltaproteobacteria bacterium]|nr:peptide chain release factor 2 [Deltaproteobacteria bacterium]